MSGEVPNPEFQVRFIKHKGVIYIRGEDVAAYIRSLGATEETDVRNRLEQAASNIEKKT